MHKSDVALGLVARVPTLAKGALWVWTRGAQWIRCDPQAGADHWLVREMVNRLQYRLPVNVRLGNGMKIKVHAGDHVGAEIIRKGYYEPEIVRLFERYLKPGMTFVDIGAHVGQYTLIASNLVGPSGQVHSFEPDPQTYAWLDSNITRNKLTNVTTNQAVLSDVPGKLEFFLSQVGDVGSNSLRPPNNFSGHTVEVRCLTIDGYLADRGVEKVDLLKIDVEGAEGPALTGGRCSAAAIVRFSSASSRNNARSHSTAPAPVWRSFLKDTATPCTASLSMASSRMYRAIRMLSVSTCSRFH
jgi:FkbM family methyltransferase